MSDQAQREMTLQEMTDCGMYTKDDIIRILNGRLQSRADLSPPVPDDVAEAVAWIEKYYLSEPHGDHNPFPAYIKTLIRAASTPSAEVQPVTEMTYGDFIQSICAYTLEDKVLQDTVAELKIRYPNGLKIKGE